MEKRMKADASPELTDLARVAAAGAAHARKPIATFSEKWDGLLEKMAGWTLDRAPYDLVVVGGGAGGVELALAMVALAARSSRRRQGPDTFALRARRGGALARASGFGADADGFLRVTSTSGAPRWRRRGTRASTRVYAAGDCASVDGHPRPKAGVFAVMAGMALTRTSSRRLGSPTPHVPQTSFLGLLGTGDGAAVASRGGLAIEAPWLWDLKDWIDRKWMWQYTAAARPLGADGDPALRGGDEGRRRRARRAQGGAHALRRLRAKVSRRSRHAAGEPAGSLTFDNGTPPPCDVVVGVDAPDDGAVVAYGPEKDQRTQVRMPAPPATGGGRRGAAGGRRRRAAAATTTTTLLLLLLLLKVMEVIVVHLWPTAGDLDHALGDF
ncbi:selenide water dikinase [Aureococcus anophagefferens]|nr:selenide water dikinase [Aureococcus anophagefferens]